MNIIESSLVKEGDKIGVVLEDVKDNVVWLRKETSKQILNSGIDLNKKYLFGIRPDHVTSSEKGIKAHVEVVEQLGDETIIYCKIENHASNVVMKAPLTTKIKINEDIFLDFNIERVYLFDKDSEHSLIGMPSFNKLPCTVENGFIKLGDESLKVDEEYLSHLLDVAFDKPNFLAIKPEHVVLDKMEDNVALKINVDFVEERTNYNIVYARIKGISQYLVFRASKERTIEVGKDMDIYLPLDKIHIFDENDDYLSIREVAFPNISKAKVTTNKKGLREIKIVGGETLVYDNLDVEDGNYEFILKQDKCVPFFNKKLCKETKTQFVKPEKGKFLSVSCYDEEPQHKSNVIYVKIAGFDEYVTLVIPNEFSVYKMPKFKIGVPVDGFILKKASEVENSELPASSEGKNESN